MTSPMHCEINTPETWSKLTRYLTRLVGCRQTAHDLAQEAYIVGRRLEERGRTLTVPSLFRISYYLAHHLFRSRQSRWAVVSLDEAGELVASDQQESLCTEALHRALSIELDALSPDDLALALPDKPLNTLAAKLEISHSAARQRRSRLMGELRANLKPLLFIALALSALGLCQSSGRAVQQQNSLPTQAKNQTANVRALESTIPAQEAEGGQPSSERLISPASPGLDDEAPGTRDDSFSTIDGGTDIDEMKGAVVPGGPETEQSENPKAKQNIYYQSITFGPSNHSSLSGLQQSGKNELHLNGPRPRPETGHGGLEPEPGNERPAQGMGHGLDPLPGNRPGQGTGHGLDPEPSNERPAQGMGHGLDPEPSNERPGQEMGHALDPERGDERPAQEMGHGLDPHSGNERPGPGMGNGLDPHPDNERPEQGIGHDHITNTQKDPIDYVYLAECDLNTPDLQEICALLGHIDLCATDFSDECLDLSWKTIDIIASTTVLSAPIRRTVLAEIYLSLSQRFADPELSDRLRSSALECFEAVFDKDPATDEEAC